MKFWIKTHLIFHIDERNFILKLAIRYYACDCRHTCAYCVALVLQLTGAHVMRTKERVGRTRRGV